MGVAPMIMKTLRRACGSLAPTCNILDRPFRRNQILDFANTTKALSRQACTKSFDPRSYAPDDRFSSDNVGTLLRKSILNQIPVDEAKARIELAACYRLFELAGWNENIYNHLTAKVIEPNGSESFLINPFGLKYGEITASSLVKVSIDGEILNPGTTGDIFGINEAGFVFHSAIHRARPEVQSVMHCHEPAATGVASVKQGYLELAQTSHQIGPVAYHDYHGVITAAESIGAAWYLMYQLLKATSIQSHASACALGDTDNLLVPSQQTVKKTFDVMQHKQFSGAAYGVKELSAYMRMLDTRDRSYR